MSRPTQTPREERDERFPESAVMGDREVEAKEQGDPPPASKEPQRTPPGERPQSQKLVADGTDG